ncbi:MAG: hypothetical protein AB7R90_17715 [Reyranellaceae bacterium]
MNAGLSHPRRSVAICLLAIVLGAGLLLWGITGLDADGNGPVLPSVAVAIGLLMCIIFPLFLVNFVWAVRLTSAMRRGENVIARWTVPVQTLEEFRAAEAERKKAGKGNDWKVPRRLPAEGLEVIFSKDAVMIGESFFGLAKSGIARFTGVAMAPGNPLAIAFGMAFTAARGISGGVVVRTYRSELRVPVARGASAEASTVLAHYSSVMAGHTVARPGFWALRIKIGLWAAGLGAASAGLGFLFNALKLDFGDAPLFMAVIGTIVGLAGLVLAGLATLLGRREREDRR